MANLQFLTQAGSLKLATARKADLANSVLHLFKAALTPNPSTPLTEFLANECDFDGYAPLTITAFDDPALAPGSGYMIFSPQQVFRWTHVSADVMNTVGGTFLVDSDGDLADVVVFGTGQPMQGPGQTVISIPVEVFPTTPA